DPSPRRRARDARAVRLADQAHRRRPNGRRAFHHEHERARDPRPVERLLRADGANRGDADPSRHGHRTHRAGEDRRACRTCAASDVPPARAGARPAVLRPPRPLSVRAHVHDALRGRRAVRLDLRPVGAHVPGRMKVGIVAPYSWSFWGAVVEHVELQAQALQARGIETRTIMGNDPPGSFTRVLHPRLGRHGHPPPDVIPGGRSVIVPANGSLPHIVLSPRWGRAVRRALESEQFDVTPLHEPMTPAICIAALALARVPVVATFHAHGALGWMKVGKPMWGFLADRIDYRIAVSPHARDSAAAWLPGEYDVVPNGVLIPPHAEPYRP